MFSIDPPDHPHSHFYLRYFVQDVTNFIEFPTNDRKGKQSCSLLLSKLISSLSDASYLGPLGLLSEVILFHHSVGSTCF